MLKVKSKILPWYHISAVTYFDPWNLVGECLPQTLRYTIEDSMTETMLSLQKPILLSYDSRPKCRGFFLA